MIDYYGKPYLSNLYSNILRIDIIGRSQCGSWLTARGRCDCRLRCLHLQLHITSGFVAFGLEVDDLAGSGVRDSGGGQGCREAN